MKKAADKATSKQAGKVKWKYWVSLNYNIAIRSKIILTEIKKNCPKNWINQINSLFTLTAPFKCKAAGRMEKLKTRKVKKERGREREREKEMS